MPLTRRTLIGSGAALTGAGLLDPGLAHAAGGTLTIALPNNPVTLDPIQTSNHDAMAVTNAIWENLLEVDLDGNVVPSLATKLPAISDDALTFTFDLRDDVAFQNGQHLTTEDVKYSYDYMLDPKNKSIRRTLFSPIRDIVIESPTRIVFRMRHPYRPWLQYMTKFMGVFPKGSREKYGDAAFRLKPVGLGTGPAIFVACLELIRDLPTGRHFHALIDPERDVPEDATRVAYLMTGQADVISAPPPRDFVRLKKTPGVQAGSKTAVGGMWFMQTNTRRAPFDDINFRKAVACAIDREAIARDVYYGLLDATATPAPTAASYFNAAANRALSYDPAKAKAYLAKSKYAANPAFELLVQSTPYLFDVKDAAVVMQSQLAAIGIKMRMTAMEMPQILARNLAGTQVASILPLMGPSDPTFIIQIAYTQGQLLSKSSGYSNPKLTAAITESYKYTDAARLDPILKQIQSILVEDSPNVWLGFIGIDDAWRDRVQNFKVNTGLTIWVRDLKLA